MQLYKKYVDVVVMQRKTGELRPLYLCWNDGREYKIDKVLSHSRKESCVGGCGIRLCMYHPRKMQESVLRKRSMVFRKLSAVIKVVLNMRYIDL